MFQEFCPLQGQWGQVLVRTTNKKKSQVYIHS